MISECKYCRKNNREKKQIQAPDMPNSKYQIENGPPHAILEINHDPSLYIEIGFYDKVRQAEISTAIAPAINYCPWCGRKLLEGTSKYGS
mgnify:CR=1 FL=1